MSLIRTFGRFSKVEEQSDGTLIVEGVASSESVDSQGEVIKASAMKAALGGYLRADGTGPVREMHQPLAAGKCVAIDVAEDGKTYITAKVVDPTAITKVKEGVYQGFSIGGSVLPGGRSKDNPKVIEAIKLVEISLVDRPANPDAVFQVVKVEDSGAAEGGGTGGASATVQGSAAPAAEPEKPVKKGMFTVSWAAELLSSLAALASDTQWEADFEGDGSPIPARLKALATEFGAILRDLVAEETAELVGDAEEAVVVEMASKPGALKKSERFAAIAKAFAAAVKGEPLVKVEVAQPDTEQLQKMLNDAIAALPKPTVDVAAFEKRAADAETERDKALKLAGEADTAIKGLLKEREELRVQLATKGVLKVVPVGKDEDNGGVKKDEPPPPPEGTPERALYEIKKTQASGGIRLGPA